MPQTRFSLKKKKKYEKNEAERESSQRHTAIEELDENVLCNIETERKKNRRRKRTNKRTKE